MKTALVSTAALLAAALSGCAIVPAEPGYAYAAPPPVLGATVVVRPAPRYYYGRPHWHGYWR